MVLSKYIIFEGPRKHARLLPSPKLLFRSNLYNIYKFEIIICYGYFNKINVYYTVCNILSFHNTLKINIITFLKTLLQVLKLGLNYISVFYIIQTSE